MDKKAKIGIFRHGYNFIKRVSDSKVLKQTAPLGLIPPDLEDIVIQEPDVTKFLLDKALKDESLNKVKIDFKSDAFRQQIRKRAIVKSIKQKMPFFSEEYIRVKYCKIIRVAKALNPIAQLPLSMDLYFGISMPVFITLHTAEYGLPPSPERKTVQFTKTVIGIPYCVRAECVDRVISYRSRFTNG